jgi:polyhydroxyalkanoate synthesis regulator phasin
MNKNELIDSLVEEYELTMTFARDVVDSLFQCIRSGGGQGRLDPVATSCSLPGDQPKARH